MLENGFMPTEEMLAAMGLTSDQAQAYIDFYKQMVANTAKYSSGSSVGSSASKSSSGSSGYSNNQSVPSAPSAYSGNTGNSGNQSYNIDMNSVLQLGYGPIDSDTLASLESQGEIESYVDGNLIKFRKLASAPSSTQSPMLPSLSLLRG